MLRGSIDCVKYVNTSTFITGGADDGTISLWTIDKRKPRHSQHAAHGTNNDGLAYWITSLSAPNNSDLFASASCSGEVILWSLLKQGNSSSFSSFKELKRIKVLGFVNCMNFIIKQDQLDLVIGTGQEHRLGRWWTDKKAKNSIFKFSIVSET